MVRNTNKTLSTLKRKGVTVSSQAQLHCQLLSLPCTPSRAGG